MPTTRCGWRRVVGCDPCGAPNKCRRARRPDLRNPMPTILVIDDNPSVATALDVLFSLQDIDTLRAESPREGLERSEEHTSELQSLMRISYAVFCLQKKHETT